MDKMIEARELIDAAMRSGQVRIWRLDVVYSKDSFTHYSGSEPKIEHRPVVFGDRGNFLGAYSIVVLSNNEQSFEFMRAEDVLRARSQSKQQGPNSPWSAWFDEMAKKAVAKRHAKRFSHIPALQKLIDADNEDYHHEAQSPPPRASRQKPKQDPAPAGYVAPSEEEPKRALLSAVLERLGGDELAAKDAVTAIASIYADPKGHGDARPTVFDDVQANLHRAKLEQGPKDACPVCIGRKEITTAADRHTRDYDRKYSDRSPPGGWRRLEIPCPFCHGNPITPAVPAGDSQGQNETPALATLGNAAKTISEAQGKRAFALAMKGAAGDRDKAERVIRYLLTGLGYERMREIRRSEYDDFCKAAEEGVDDVTLEAAERAYVEGEEDPGKINEDGPQDR